MRFSSFLRSVFRPVRTPYQSIQASRRLSRSNSTTSPLCGLFRGFLSLMPVTAVRFWVLCWQVSRFDCCMFCTVVTAPSRYENWALAIRRGLLAAGPFLVPVGKKPTWSPHLQHAASRGSRCPSPRFLSISYACSEMELYEHTSASVKVRSQQLGADVQTKKASKHTQTQTRKAEMGHDNDGMNHSMACIRLVNPAFGPRSKQPAVSSVKPGQFFFSFFSCCFSIAVDCQPVTMRSK